MEDKEILTTDFLYHFEATHRKVDEKCENDFWEFCHTT